MRIGPLSNLLKLFLIVVICLAAQDTLLAQGNQSKPLGGGRVRIIDMKMMILPGTQSFLHAQINEASQAGDKLLIVRFDTPGGLLDTSQLMIQDIFRSPVPVVIYVNPTGATAASAGVFITMAGHVAAMAPGTSIGAAHPVQGDGKNIEGDMRTKAENMTVAMVKAIAERRGRNVAWVEKAVKESSSLTEKEALQMGVVDLVADDIDDLLRQIAGREVKLDNTTTKLEDYSKLPRDYYQISFQEKFLNVLANPNVAALLWLAATTGISLELYNPGAVLPGVVGVICLILALAVSQIIPLSTGAILLIVVGALLIGAELFTGTFVLGVGGVIAMVLGAIYLVDTSQAPDLRVAMELVLPSAILTGGLLLFVAGHVAKVIRQKPRTGVDALLGQKGRAVENITPLQTGATGRVFLSGEYWNACSKEGVIEKGAEVIVLERKDLLLVVRRAG